MAFLVKLIKSTYYISNRELKGWLIMMQSEEQEVVCKETLNPSKKLKKIGFLSDPLNKKSSSRLIKVGSWVFAVGITIYGVITKQDVILYVTAFLTLAAANEITSKVTNK